MKSEETAVDGRRYKRRFAAIAVLVALIVSASTYLILRSSGRQLSFASGVSRVAERREDCLRGGLANHQRITQMARSRACFTEDEQKLCEQKVRMVCLMCFLAIRCTWCNEEVHGDDQP